MSLTDLFRQAKERVASVIEEPFDVREGRIIPGLDALPFGNRGTVVETAVLFADLRSSTDLTDTLRSTTVAKIHKCFLNEMVRAVAHWNGHVRSFAGDRIMVLCEPGDSSCEQAFNIAITMQNLAHYVIDPAIYSRYKTRVRCGIGIDYGKMLVARVGMQRDPVRTDLVWVGGPANVASKLADRAPAEQIRITREVLKRLSKESRKWWKSTSQIIAGKETPMWWAKGVYFQAVNLA